MWNGSHHRHIEPKQEDQQAKLDAVSALASFAQQQTTGYSARDPYSEAYYVTQQQPMSRQYSDGSDGVPYNVRATQAAAAGYPVDSGPIVSASPQYYNGNGGYATATSYSDMTATSNSNVSFPGGVPAAAYTADSYPQASSPTGSAYSSEGLNNGGGNGTKLQIAYGESPTYSGEPQRPAQPRGKPEAMARAIAASQLESDRREAAQRLDDDDDAEEVTAPPPPRKTPKKAKPPNPKKTKKKSPTPSPSLVSSLHNGRRSEYTLGEPAPPITADQYANLAELMTEFCRVPLLAEFSRPVSLLHPDLSKSYSNIVSLPVDLGHVCRGIRRREYKTCRDVRLDMWLVFSNCVKYNSHAGNKDAIPSFVSIAQHLREYFNQLWQECMLTSEIPQGTSAMEKIAFEDRKKDRQNRLDSTGVLVLHNNFLVQLSNRLTSFLDRGGRVDRLDVNPIFVENLDKDASDDDLTEVDIVVQRLREFQRQLHQHAQDATVEYQLIQLYGDLKRCYTEDVLEDDPIQRNLFANRIERFLWRQCTSLHEANSRGVTQSSIWGNIAACIWARESGKKAYWPAICLGILPPPEQGEGWHHAVTERNENRLPPNLRGPLAQAKKQCEKNQKRAKHSYFLVEFLGTHEFTWVRETDIVENFDPDPSNDPNKRPVIKKGRSSRSNSSNAVGSKLYQRAIEECVFANNEYESVLNDAMSTVIQADDDDDDDVNYSFAVLAQSDDEADLTESHGYDFAADTMGDSDVEEVNYLLANNGALDVAAIAKKSAKKKTPGPKTTSAKGKKPADKDDSSTATKKAKPEKSTKDKVKVDKKEQRELDRRRKKRSRDREKALRLMARKKRRRSGIDCADEAGYDLTFDKKNRATAIVKAYLTRLSKKEDGKSLALNGVITMPAAMVDSTGMLGTTLAFRAAAGLIRMPDDGKEVEERRKPWLAINPGLPKTSNERVDLLKKKIDLMEKRMETARSETKKRRALAADYTERSALAETSTFQDDVAARQNTFKKKPTVKKAKPAEKSPKKKAAVTAMATEDPTSDVDVESEVVVEVEGLADDEDDATSGGMENSEMDVDNDVESIAKESVASIEETTVE